MQTVTKYIDI